MLAGKAREAVIMRMHNRNWEAAERIAQYYLKYFTSALCPILGPIQKVTLGSTPQLILDITPLKDVDL